MTERVSYDSLSLHEYSTIQCASRMNEIWVPTENHKLIFTQLLNSFGMPHPRIAVVEEAVDTDLFDPDLYTNNFPIHINQNVDCNKRKIQDSLATAPFVFLSIFKWEYRKGWDVLLEAYWSAFRVEDPVVLKIKYKYIFIFSLCVNLNI